MKVLQKKWLKICLILISAASYFLLGYQVPRSEFPVLVSLFGVLFLAYFLLYRSDISIKNGLILGFGFRLILLFSIPAHSDDYFRFLWDGRLFISGENPFLHLPSFYADQNFLGITGLNNTLYSGLNSPDYFSVYPPVCQFIFALAAFIDPENNLVGIIVMRSFILLAEANSFWLLLKLLAYFKLPARNALLYVLNPLIILELTGNLHFEALVISFTLLAFYLLVLNRTNLSAIALGFAICSKLIPLLVLPFIFKRLGLKKGILFCGVSGLTCLVLFLPFLTPELVAHFGSSLNLYFQKFEFNASIYYLLRWLGFYFYGYNQIAKIGILLSILTFLIVVALAFSEKNASFKILPEKFLQALTIYLLLATVVHPWYLATLVAMSILTNSRYALVWSGLAILSYAAYQTQAYTENPLLIFLEYGGLASVIFYEKRYGWETKNSADFQIEGSGRA